MIKGKGNPFGEEILYYCKDCEKIVEAQQVGRKYVFRCPICKTKNVAFGTEKSLKNFFHISDEPSDEPKVSHHAAEKEKQEKMEKKS